jgi:hypothetical protein
MHKTITTRDVCERLDLSESALRHILRRANAPRPQLHPSARIFLWTEEDVDRIKRFLASTGARGARPAVSQGSSEVDDASR